MVYYERQEGGAGVSDIFGPDKVAWSWVFSAVVLFIVEVATPGLVAIFFGLAALVMALLVALWPGISGAWQSVLFALLSIVFLVALRRLFKKVFTGRRTAINDTGLGDDFVGRTAVITEAIHNNLPGRVEFNGTSWSAIAKQPIPVGAVVEIVSKDNLTLAVRQVTHTEEIKE